jgi:hypothetical protein
MKSYLLLAVGQALDSCAAQQQLTPGADVQPLGHSQPIAKRDSTGLVPDSLVLVPYAQPQPGRGAALWQKLNPFRPAAAAPQALAGMPTRIGKKATLNVYYGTTTITNAGKKSTVAAGAGAVATVIEKKAGPAVVASDSSTLNAVAGGGNLAAVQGDGNTTSQTKQDTTKEAPGPLAVIADNATAWLPWVLGGGAVVGIVIFLIRRKATNAIS